MGKTTQETFAQMQAMTGHAPLTESPSVLTGVLESDDFEPGSRGRLVSGEQVERFLLAGNATITIVSKRTNDRYTFKVRKPQDFEVTRPIWFVSVLKGSDNENDYGYVGQIVERRGKYVYEQGRKCWPQWRAASAGFSWMFNGFNIDAQKVWRQVEVWHEGRCGRCGRKLTVPESVASGFGPECVEKV